LQPFPWKNETLDSMPFFAWISRVAVYVVPNLQSVLVVRRPGSPADLDDKHPLEFFDIVLFQSFLELPKNGLITAESGQVARPFPAA